MSVTSVRDRSSLAYSPEFTWPGGFERIPDDDWTRQPVDQFGLSYDSVGGHGWYKNLEPTIAQVLAALDPGKLLIDYSSGTGILTRRLLERIYYSVGMLNVDASTKFLRVALENFAADERVAFRLLRWLKQEKRLERLDEVAGPAITSRGADILTSANAIHLYYNLDETLASWARVLRPGGLAFIRSAILSGCPSVTDSEVNRNPFSPLLAVIGVLLLRCRRQRLSRSPATRPGKSGARLSRMPSAFIV